MYLSIVIDNKTHKFGSNSFFLICVCFALNFNEKKTVLKIENGFSAINPKKKCEIYFSIVVIKIMVIGCALVSAFYVCLVAYLKGHEKNRNVRAIYPVRVKGKKS